MVAEEGGVGSTHGSQFFWKTEGGGEAGRIRGGKSSKGKQAFLLAISSLNEEPGALSFVYVVQQQSNLNGCGKNPAICLQLLAHQQITTPQCSLAT